MMKMRSMFLVLLLALSGAIASAASKVRTRARRGKKNDNPPIASAAQWG